MEKPRLSKWVIPLFGPGQPARHSVPLMVQRRPFPAWAHGAGFSFSTVAMISEGQRRVMLRVRLVFGTHGITCFPLVLWRNWIVEAFLISEPIGNEGSGLPRHSFGPAHRRALHLHPDGGPGLTGPFIVWPLACDHLRQVQPYQEHTPLYTINWFILTICWKYMMNTVSVGALYLVFSIVL